LPASSLPVLRLGVSNARTENCSAAQLVGRLHRGPRGRLVSPAPTYLIHFTLHASTYFVQRR
jgi:hypothetical protein